MFYNKDWTKGKYLLLKWVIILVIFFIILTLEYRWRRMIHIITGFMWWGMVFFLITILLPKIEQMKKSTQFEIIGYLIPRIFRTVSVVAFFAVLLGWYNTLNDISYWNIDYFFLRIENTLFLLGNLMITGLYLFHLFLENREIKLAFNILKEPDNDDVSERVEDLIAKIKIIPYIGFTILTTGVILMFIH
ncbi:MAG: hypothetical protein HeimC3_34850 [Candidatus Heimdallarchaeota archaeon LC_3]|nr:MAG: hypothetical protein HeimC3_37310 [Candidatus Heimdallarchaeota archaeon LC_3]OLS21576.1 MAG: hypothetical protein HeimC3_34850 [Candidatus Heimdallarchaeota archaeon LC_3]